MTSVTDPEHIAISKSKGIEIDWKDGHHSDYELQLPARQMPLRDLHRRARHATAAASRLRALRFSCTSPGSKCWMWSRSELTRSGSTGATGTTPAFIPWAHLRSICPCEACTAGPAVAGLGLHFNSDCIQAVER